MRGPFGTRERYSKSFRANQTLPRSTQSSPSDSPIRSAIVLASVRGRELCSCTNHTTPRLWFFMLMQKVPVVSVVRAVIRMAQSVRFTNNTRRLTVRHAIDRRCTRSEAFYRQYIKHQRSILRTSSTAAVWSHLAPRMLSVLPIMALLW